MSAIIDILVPVYRGYAATRRCFDSLLASAPRDAEIIAIDDASDDARIVALLDELAASGRIRLLRHARNQGFVAAVNSGMALHADRDLVLLNSDTAVANDWLDRLRVHAAAPCVGTVTPFSNDATLCSYPRVGMRNPPLTDQELATLDRLASTVNAGRSVDLPTGVGFCLLLRRACLNQIGPFDLARFGMGYGEEVDFCLRASAAGWRHLLATDVFVHHEGQVSFGASAEARKARAQAIIDAAYPDYQARIARWFANDPARPARRRLDFARLARAERLLLFVTHAGGGGVERHIEDLAALLAPDATVLTLGPHGPRRAQLRWQDADEEFTLLLDLEQDRARAFDLLRGLGLSRLHYHQVAGLPRQVLELPAALDLPYDVTVHDYGALCPRYHLVTAAGEYCGEPEPAVCDRCLVEPPAPIVGNGWPMGIDAWRGLWGDWLAGAARVICPSADTRDRLRRYWPTLSCELWPHPPLAAHAWGATTYTAGRFVKVLILGGLSHSKGFALVAACAEDARARGLPLLFKVLGPSAPPRRRWPETALLIEGSYQDANLPDLIALERADVALFPARVPETYCYTLQAAMRAELPIVASALDIFAERLRDYPAKRLLPLMTPPAAWNAALLACAGLPNAPPRVSGPALTDAAARRAYRRRYLEPIPPREQPVDVAAALAACDADPRHWLFADPGAMPPPRALSELYGAVLDHRDWRLLGELARRVPEAELELADARWERAELRRQLTVMDAERARLARAMSHQQRAHADYAALLARERDEARTRLVALELSRWWRLTAPLRALLTRLRQPRGSRVRRPAPRAEVLPSWRFLRAEQPLVSVCMLLNDQTIGTDHLRACLAALSANLDGIASEVMLFDDASGTGARLLRQVLGQTDSAGIDAYPAITGQTPLARCNAAAERALGGWLWWLDGALEPQAGALAALLAASEPQHVALVAPKLRFTDGPLLAAGYQLDAADGWRLAGHGGDPAHPAFHYRRRIVAAPWCGLLIRREAFARAGGYDPRAEDRDLAALQLARALAAAGNTCWYQPLAELRCLEADSQHDCQPLPAWGKTACPDWTPPAERERQFLLLGNGAYWQAHEGRLPALLRAYQRSDMRINLMLDDALPSARLIAALAEQGVALWYPPYLDSVDAALLEFGDRLDGIVFGEVAIAVRWVTLARARAPAAQLLLDAGDAAALLPVTDERDCARPHQQTVAELLAMVSACDHTLVKHPVAAAAIRRALPAAMLSILPD